MGIVGLLLGSWPNLANASDVRVDSTGGLSLVLSDETTEITPYNLGNPAGMALLPAGGSIGMNLPLINLAQPNNAYNETHFGISSGFIPTFPNLNNTLAPMNPTAGNQYQGLLYVTPDQWAFQATGGFNDIQSTDNGLLSVAKATQGGQELVRAAKELGPLTLGTELQFSESGINEQFSSNPTIPVIGSSTQTNSSSGNLNSGLLVNFQLGEEEHPVWLRMGGTFAFNVMTPHTVGSISINPFEAILNSSNTVFEPSLFVEVPSSFQGGILLSLQNQTDEFGVINGDTNQVSTPYFKTENISVENVAVLYKWRMPLVDPGNPHPFSFNHGALFQLTSSQTSYWQPDGSSGGNMSVMSYNFQGGVGLEWKKDLTLGIQLNWYGITSTPDNSPVGLLSNDYISRFGFGGEKWVAENWSIRLGIVEENAQNPCQNGANDGYFGLDPNQSLSGLMGTAGIGYDNKGFRMDGMVWCEQPTFTPTTPNDTPTLLGLDLDAALCF